MNWLQRKIYLYNVTFGLYMLDWWERCLFNVLVIVLMWYIIYNGSRKLSELCNSSLGYAGPQVSINNAVGVELPFFSGKVSVGRCVDTLTYKLQQDHVIPSWMSDITAYLPVNQMVISYAMNFKLLAFVSSEIS